MVPCGSHDFIVFLAMRVAALSLTRLVLVAGASRWCGMSGGWLMAIDGTDRLVLLNWSLSSSC